MTSELGTKVGRGLDIFAFSSGHAPFLQSYATRLGNHETQLLTLQTKRRVPDRCSRLGVSNTRTILPAYASDKADLLVLGELRKCSSRFCMGIVPTADCTLCRGKVKWDC